MWKRNVSLGLTGVLVIVTAVLSITNVKQQSRIDALEKIRTSTSETVSAEVQRYLNSNTSGIFLEAVEDSGISTTDLVNNAIGSVIETNENGAKIIMELSETQKAELANKISEIAYENLSKEVLSGQTSIDTVKMESEIATAVTEVLSKYIDNIDKEYVTVEGNTDAIVKAVLAQLNYSTSVSNTESNIKNAISEEQIAEMVKKLYNESSITKDNIKSYQDAIVQETIAYIQQHDLLKPGANGKDGKDAVTPVYGQDYFTEEDIAELIESVQAEVSANGLKAYGTAGAGITDAQLDGQDLVLTVESADDATLNKEFILDDVVGNSIMGIETIAANDEGTEFDLVYYTKFETENSIPVVDENGIELYQNNAGTISIGEDYVSDFVSQIENSIVENLRDALGNDVGDIFTKLDSIETTINDLTASINGEDTTTKGLNTLVDGTDENGTGSLSDFFASLKGQDGNSSLSSKVDALWDVINGKGDVSYTNSDGETVELPSYQTLVDTMTTDVMIVTIPLNSMTENTDYNTVTVSYDGENAYPNFSLVGSADDAGKVPSNAMSELWTFCKYMQVDTQNDKITFYFTKDSNTLFDNLRSKQSELYVSFANTEVPNDGVACLTNQTRNNYGALRVKDYNTSNNVLTITGAGQIDDEGVLEIK